MKPIHKFNGGSGATLCHKCYKIISNGFTDDLYCKEHNDEESIYKYKLVREHDGLVKAGNVAYWIEWDENNRGKKPHQEPAIGYSFVLDLMYGDYTWLTTEIEEILDRQDNYFKFKTKNSIYELFINETENK